METTALLLENIKFSYPSEPHRQVFESLSATIPLSGNTMILGPNASGKTALARLLGGLDSPTAGKIHWPPDKRDCAGDFGWEPLQAGVVFENPEYQFQAFTVGEELETGLIYRGADSVARMQEVAEAAGKFGLAPLLEKRLQDLERPQKLTVLVAAFLILRPRLLALDFSLSCLENRFLEALLEESRKSQGPALVVTSRRAEDLALLGPAAQVYLLRKDCLEALESGAGDPGIAARLENEGIGLPWYAGISAQLRGRGLISAVIYGQEAEFIREAERVKIENRPGD